ncbi:MAG: DUF5067 domain-containing protein [Eggerthellaceae bacterium]|nr:DUF5067 domain-containing protein [Eggerthellaceae bacterium]
MKRLSIIAIVAAALTLCLALVGCSGGGSKYQEQTVEFDGWEITITNDQVIYDEEEQTNNLIVWFTAKNNKDRAASMNGDANMQVSQDGEKLFLAQVVDENGKNYYVFEDWMTEIEPGESIDLASGAELISDSPVKFVFSGSSSDIVDAELEFAVADRMTK